ncbi:MAG: hypothetical protein CMD16_04730 [Flavobacteriales bacterium]|nr:hypothetical protein [Flavobacteriales bacterium]|tara:strand:- start:26685 stop:29792 length:3108 start_codon:yes stop_codon:yes gene_type:complete
MKILINFLCFTLFISGDLIAQYDFFPQAKSLFNDEKYSVSQSIFRDIASNHSLSNGAEAMYLNARCSKKLFLSDAKHLYEELINDFTCHEFGQEVNSDLALIYYRNKQYTKAIDQFLKIDELSNEFLFKLAYSNFQIDSLEEAQYYFSKLKSSTSKFAPASQYYYACIAYERGLYKSSLESFRALLTDEKFGNIVPYYMAQIYFHQKEYKELISFVKPLSVNVIASRKAEINRFLAEAYYRTSDFINSIDYFEVYLSERGENSLLVYFLLGHAYYKSGDYLSAIANLEKVSSSVDSIAQYSTYYLASSYLKIENYNYALQAFKKSATYDYNSQLKEHAYFNYAKLSYQLELPFENTLDVFKTYLEAYNNPLYRKQIEMLMVQVLQGTSRYLEAFDALKDIHLPTLNQQKALQKLAFFLGVKEYNHQNFKSATSYFKDAIRFPINDDYFYLSNFWLADCYFQLLDYKKSIQIYSELLPPSNRVLSDYEHCRKYNLAYSYFQDSDYLNAIKWFRTYEKVSQDSMRLNDSYLRIADSYFMMSDFDLSERYYEKAITYNLFDTDYALYNRSISLGLVGKNISKVKLLKQITDDYTYSSYCDNALYDLAEFYKNSAQYDLAHKCYDDLLNKTNDINLIADAHLSKGMIYFNSTRNDEAITQFLFVVNNYQRTIYFKEALAGLQAAYSSLNQIDKYLAVIDALPEVSISRSEQDSLTYNAAFMKFSELNYHVAKSAFDNYLEKFSTGIFINDATYYNAISSLKIGDSISSINLYKRVLELPVPDYQEPALLFLARGSYAKDNYSLSNNYYYRLLDYASSNSVKREVVIRLMHGYEDIDNSVAFDYAKQVIELEKVDDWLLSKAYIIIARNEFALGNYAKSKSTFEKVISLSNYDQGAEAKYHLAYLIYLDDKIELAEKMIFELSEEYSNDHYIAKGFILLSDIYVLQKNLFQAKATLESVIENHDGEEIVNIARKKWEKIVENEKEVVLEETEDQYFIEITEDDFEYQLDEDYEVPDPIIKINSIDTLGNFNKNVLEDEIE